MGEMAERKREEMNIKEIEQRRQQQVAKVEKAREPLLPETELMYVLVFWLGEIAVQLAKMNEKER